MSTSMGFVFKFIRGFLFFFCLLFVILILFVRESEFINVNDLSFKREIRFAGILVYEKVEASKLTDFINKEGFGFSEPPRWLCFSESEKTRVGYRGLENSINFLSSYLIDLYRMKCIEKEEVQETLNKLREAIKNHLKEEAFKTAGDANLYFGGLGTKFYKQYKDRIEKCWGTPYR